MEIEIKEKVTAPWSTLNNYDLFVVACSHTGTMIMTGIGLSHYLASSNERIEVYSTKITGRLAFPKDGPQEGEWWLCKHGDSERVYKRVGDAWVADMYGYSDKFVTPLKKMVPDE